MPTCTARRILGDILEGKRTLILIHTMAHCTPKESRRLSRLFGKPRSNRRRIEVEWVLGLMQKYGSITHARTSSRQLAAPPFASSIRRSPGRPTRKIKDL